MINSFKISSLYRFARKLYHRSRTWITDLWQVPIAYRDRVGGLDHSSVTVYTGKNDPWPEYPLKCNLQKSGEVADTLKVTLVAAVKNEAGNVVDWFRAVRNQTRLPDEVIVVDGGSTDGTIKLLETQMVGFPVPLRIDYTSGGNIAGSRNLAISQALHPIIAVLDFGCLPEKDWLENLLNPFFQDPATQVSAGIYNPISQNGKAKKNADLWVWSHLARIHPREYLPPGGSVAFRKEAWLAIGGYPEWLTLTGEDTYFDLELKRLGGKWAIVPSAIVDWCAPEKLSEYVAKLYRWAVGDGEAGINARHYWKNLLRLGGIALAAVIAVGGTILFARFSMALAVGWFIFSILAFLGATMLLARRQGLFWRTQLIRLLGEVAQQLGFLKGAARRRLVDEKRFKQAKEVYFILSGVPVDDTGGGARGTQIANQLLNRGVIVVFIYAYPRFESRNLDLRIHHPNLLVFPLSNFDWTSFSRDHSSLIDKPLKAIVESPMEGFLPVIEHIRNWNGVVAYDLLDDWTTSLGMDWYSPEGEKRVIESCQVLTATAPHLQERLEKLSERDVHLIPNAVNDRLFDPLTVQVRPRDLPIADWNILYTGALWGEWFDWELVCKIAERYPNAAVTLVGDYRGQFAKVPPNVHFTGLKPQTELPAYLAFSQVAIIPWKLDAITQATSPLKAYEYLSMQVPVVAPDLPALKGLPGIFLAHSADEFIELVGSCWKHPVDRASLAAFVSANNWHSRMELLLDSMKGKAQQQGLDILYNEGG